MLPITIPGVMINNMQKTIFSGIQPSGNLHIGNYIGAIKQWVRLQNNDSIFCIVDLHAITVYQDPKVLKEKILEVAALYIACGIDPSKSKIFVQSENPDHSYLAWIFDCITPIGWMNKMIQFKDKSRKIVGAGSEEISIGLFNYPALMAADILLYDTDLVPVGEDQTQHVELTRDIAERFNKLYGVVFKLPKVMIDKEAARIMSLQNPQLKMSKSDKDPIGTINLLDSADEINKKIKRAVTDSGKGVIYSPDKPALSNLLVIYSKLSDISIEEIIKKHRGAGYAEFKKDLTEVVVSVLKPIQDKYHKLRQEKTYLQKVLNDGLRFTLSKSSKKIKEVKRAMGLERLVSDLSRES